MLQEGITYIHEHMTIDLSEVKESEDCKLDLLNETIEEMKELYALGVRNIIDMTNTGMGRNIPYVERIMQETGMTIVHATGYYQHMCLPIQVFERSVSELAERMIREIQVGIKGTKSRAGVIGEIATSENVWTDAEKKVFDAAIIAHKETGTPISTHTSIGTLGHEQVSYFKEQKIDMEKVIIGHVDLTGDAEYVLHMLDQGVYVEFDTIGKESYMPDLMRVKMLHEIEKRGFTDKVCLSMDITRKSHLKKNGGLGYAYLLTDFVPQLREAGISESFIQKMLVHNPRAFFK